MQYEIAFVLKGNIRNEHIMNNLTTFVTHQLYWMFQATVSFAIIQGLIFLEKFNYEFIKD